MARNVHRKTPHRLAAVLLGVLFATVGHSGVYRWVDENGVTVYSQVPPPASIDNKKMDLPPPPPPTSTEQQAGPGLSQEWRNQEWLSQEWLSPPNPWRRYSRHNLCSKVKIP